MKRLNLILLLSAVTVALAFVISCKETNTGRLEKMRGDWVSTGNKPPFTLSEENEYRVTVIKKKSHAGNYPDGNVPRAAKRTFASTIETGLADI